jgi:mannose-6-phosphate isomerase-like protein (cupin superfamily)
MRRDVILIAAAVLTGVAGTAAADAGPATSKPGGTTGESPAPALSATEALRFARQAEAAGAANNLKSFTGHIDQALEVALKAGTQAPSHRMAEAIHALSEGLTRAHQGSLDEAREDVQTGIVWLSRAAGLPANAPSATWSPARETASQKESSMDHFVTDIEEATVKNEDFRRVLYTAPNSQLVLMTLKPGEDIGAETHHLDQFIRVEAGRGTAQLNGKDYPIHDGSALVIPAGTRHNVINTGRDEALKLYTLYSPPEHKDGTVHRTKQEAEADRDDHFDGKTTAMLHESPSR